MAIEPLRMLAPTSSSVPHRNEPPTGPTVQIDPARIAAITAAESARLDGRTQASAAAYARAEKTLVGGVSSSYQRRAPYPIEGTLGREHLVCAQVVAPPGFTRSTSITGASRMD